MLIIIDQMQLKLLKRRPRLPRIRLPKRGVSPPAPPVVATQAPQKPQERRFASIPMAEAIDHVTQPPTASLSPHLRDFVERGDRAINGVSAKASSPSSQRGQPVASPAQERGRFIPPKSA